MGNGPYYVVSDDPFRVQDSRGRFAKLVDARAWCEAHGHRFGPLIPDRAWIDQAWDDAYQQAGLQRPASPPSQALTMAELQEAWAAADVLCVGIYIPPARWTCEQCGIRAWPTYGTTPDAALAEERQRRSSRVLSAG